MLENFQANVLKTLWINFRLRLENCICSDILGELEYSRIYLKGVFGHFPKTLGFIAFPKMIADFFSAPKSYRNDPLGALDQRFQKQIINA